MTVVHVILNEDYATLEKRDKVGNLIRAMSDTVAETGWAVYSDIPPLVGCLKVALQPGAHVGNALANFHSLDGVKLAYFPLERNPFPYGPKP